MVWLDFQGVGWVGFVFNVNGHPGFEVIKVQ